jgi:hypothetical protein
VRYTAEADLLTHSKLTSKNITCFLFNKTLMSVIREPRSYGRIAVTIILRDLSGKFVWNANLNYFPCVPEHISGSSTPLLTHCAGRAVTKLLTVASHI